MNIQRSARIILIILCRLLFLSVICYNQLGRIYISFILRILLSLTFQPIKTVGERSRVYQINANFLNLSRILFSSCLSDLKDLAVSL